MELTLTPEIERRIERQLAKGFDSPQEVVLTALATLEDQELGLSIDRDELEYKLKEAIAAADRGETVSAEEARAQLATFRASL